MKRKDITLSHVVELRDGTICYLADRNGDFVLYSTECGRGSNCGVSTLCIDYNDDLLDVDHKLSSFDIMKVSRLASQNEAIWAVMSKKDIKWDWIRDDGQDEINRLKDEISRLKEENEKLKFKISILELVSAVRKIPNINPLGQKGFHC